MTQVGLRGTSASTRPRTSCEGSKFTDPDKNSTFFRLSYDMLRPYCAYQSATRGGVSPRPLALVRSITVNAQASCLQLGCRIVK